MKGVVHCLDGMHSMMFERVEAAARVWCIHVVAAEALATQTSRVPGFTDFAGLLKQDGSVSNEKPGRRSELLDE